MSSAQSAATAEDLEPEGAEITPFVDEPWLPRLMNPEIGLPAAAVAAGTGALAWWLASGTGTGAVLAAATGLLCAALVVLGVIDTMTKRLPDVIVLPLYPILILAAAGTAAAGVLPWSAFLTALACMAGCYALYWLICFFTGGLGWGDAKLAGVLGFAMGLAGPWDAVYGVLVLPMVLGGLVGFPMLFRGGGRLELPFGPFMVAAALPVLMMPDHLVPLIMGAFR